MERFADWGVNVALPFWAGHAWDRRSGGFLESLSLDGRPVTGDTRRVRTQARQVYVFARAHLAGWCDGFNLAVDGFELLERRAKSPDGKPGWVHRLSDSGEVEDPMRDLYDHAFLLLALAWLHRLTRDSYYRNSADALIAYLDDAFGHPAGGYCENVGGAALPRRQNPHMHFFECLLAWHEATADPEYLRRAGHILTLLEDRFMVAPGGFLAEHFDNELRPAPRPDEGLLVEPGHELEWVWLLDEGREAGLAVRENLPDELYAHACRFGRNAKTGFMMSAISGAGDIIDGGSRTWVQTEWLRAALARQRLSHVDGGSEVERAAAQLLQHHIDPALPGGWIDQVDASGQRVADRMPASTLYHLLGAVVEADRAGSKDHESASDAL
ncbi:hypothetical protein AWH62_11510 [Maricaulis sp. W15]|uniref:AGE family epimerase/isomerase n=1 Tax=Maricaulis sp. W15 TaxID=1772333 RepID=UPI000948C3BC|nr:AGE family epimerase/isomerase [Maricaulis sp. W15]OLF71756.1 hypothetical protein AWH62_11510 [Maricaulis sp. W15]